MVQKKSTFCEERRQHIASKKEDKGDLQEIVSLGNANIYCVEIKLWTACIKQVEQT